MPYFGWHDLRICYSNTGWLLVEQRIRVASPGNGSNQADWPYVEAVMRSTTGEYGHLFFSMFDVIGREIYPPESFWTSLTRRFDHRWQDRAEF